MLRLFTNTLIVMLVSLLIISANVRKRQQTQYQEGLAGERAGSFMKALTGYESAIRMYLPFSPTVERSAERIWYMGETAEKNHDAEQALIAYRSLRSAFYAVRWIKQPGKTWISRCDSKIAALVALRKKENR